MRVQLAIALVVLLVSACRTPERRIKDPADDLVTDYVATSPDGEQHELRGKASWYGEKFHGRKTASGEPYDMYAFTAAHKTLPFHTIVRVREVESNKTVVVRITDRGPFKPGRVIDLSWAAAKDLDMVTRGVVSVELEVIQWGDGTYVRE